MSAYNLEQRKRDEATGKVIAGCLAVPVLAFLPPWIVMLALDFANDEYPQVPGYGYWAIMVTMMAVGIVLRVITAPFRRK